jgi:nucleotide-binding universal stress UspA family protein
VHSERIDRLTWFVNRRSILEPKLRTKGYERFRRGNGEVSRRAFTEAESDRDYCQPGALPTSLLYEESQAGKPVVLVPLDFSTGNTSAVRMGLRVASHLQGKLVFCHAVFSQAVPFDRGFALWLGDALREEAIQKAQPVLKLAEQVGVSADCVIEEGTPAAIILKVARQYSASLIVLTSRDHSAWARLLFGPDTTEQVTRKANCQVLVMRKV